MPPGEYRLGQHRVIKQEDAVRLADGTLAGSILTMEQALRNLLHLGMPLEQAARRCATLQADYLGLAERGRLVPGAAADLVVLDRAGRLEAVFIEGRAIPPVGD
jgi:N-acetylglucosamine-6-phosphate deacetylase